MVTRYWLRTPDATGTDPARLPRACRPPRPAPPRRLDCQLVWAWDQQMTEQTFTTLLRNYGTWHERNSQPGSPHAPLCAVLQLMNRGAGSFMMNVWVDADIPGADGLVNDLVTAVTAGTGTTPADTRTTMPWLHPTTWPGTGQTGDAITPRFKNKAGYLRRSYTDTQLTTIYRHLTDPTASPTGLMMLAGYGGQANAVPPKATAIAQRDAVMKVIFLTTWTEESDDAAHLAWIRDFYRDVYAETGGVPVPGEVSDGSYINYPDSDLADPKWNTSRVPWHTLYYKDNYPRLQQIKAHWDPGNVFHHFLSIQPPA